MKLAGIHGLGAFLLHSKRMLILYDSTYHTRLWCVFEMAAFLHVHGEQAPSRLCVRPIIHAPIIAIVLLTNVAYWTGENLGLDQRVKYCMFAVSIFVNIHAMKHCQRGLVSLVKSFETFSVDHADCFCCSVGHVHPTTSEHLKCDRQAIEKCIEEWFGSKLLFNQSAQTVFSAIVRDLVFFNRLPYTWLLLVCLPIYLGFMKHVCTHSMASSLLLLYGLVW